MRRARGLRASSTRDVCIFCATRQLAIAGGSQRRQLNSSSRAPQSAGAQLYKDENERPKPMSQAERMRQQLAASAAFAAPRPPPTTRPPPAQQAQGGYMTPTQRARASLGTQSPQQPRQQPYERRPPNRGGLYDDPGRNQNRDRYAPPPTRRVTTSDAGGFTTYRPPAPSMPQNRFRVNMDSTPQVESPAFGAGHLRRRNQPQSERAFFEPREQRPPQVTRPAPKRAQLDQDEISKLLGNTATTGPSRPYQPLARNTNANVQRKCWHCGSVDHVSNTCPSKPVVREPLVTRRVQPEPPQSQQPQQPQQTVSLADAEQKWNVRDEAKPEVVQRAPTVQEEADKRARNLGQNRDRRRSRFDLDEVQEVRNRYEQPERRRGGQNRGRRVMREEDEEVEERVVGKAERKRLRAEAKKAAQMAKAEPTPIHLPQYISVANLAGVLKLRAEELVVKLEELGFEEVQNDHILNAEHAGLIAQEYNFEPVFLNEEEDGDLYPLPEVSPEEYAELPARPPVVTIMGHVDHGKTTILDYMRSTSVAATEFGGITQHIGAFSVPLANGKKITFLDTPGHSAFETMRARGANVTDIVVLVVAADDSVMPQTIEAIKHAHAAKVPLIVAINKIDKSQADPEAVKLDLGRHGIEIEDFGGDVQAICVSGKTGQGIPDLEEAISTLSELLDHRADPKAAVSGWVLEGTTKKSGRVATVLVRNGTLRPGTTLVAGTTWTRVRSLRNEAGVTVKEAGPGIAVEVDAWRDQPIAGDEVLQANDEQHATSVSELRVDKVERLQMARDMDAINEARRLENEKREAEKEAEEAAKNSTEEDPTTSPDVLAEATKKSGPEVISFIVKGDVSGSVEAVVDSISALGNAEISTRILRHGVGPPSEFDVQHAADASGHIVNFNTLVGPQVARQAEDKGVKILDSNIIYRVVETVKEMLEAKLPPKIVSKVTGEAEVAACFDIGVGGKKKLRVAGSKVRNMQVERGNKAKVWRGEECVHDGVISSLKNQKKDVETMRKDTECGISFEGWDEFKVGDRIQCYEEKAEKRRL